MVYHDNASSFAVLYCRKWVRTLFVVLVMAITTVPCLNATDEVEVETTHTNSSSSSSSDLDKIKPLVKKARSWILFHRILPSTTDSAVIEKIHTASSLEWRRRGTINLTIFDPKVASDEPVSLEIWNDDDALSESFIEDIRTLDGITNTTTWYQLKLVDDNDDDTTSTSTTTTAASLRLTSVPSCSVLRSNFRDELLIQFQSARSSHILSMTYVPYISRFAPKKCMDYIPIVATAVASTTTTTSSNETTSSSTTITNQTKYQFISKISWETAVPGMVVGKPQLLDPMTNLPIASSSSTNMKIKPPPGYQWFPNAVTNHRKPSSTGTGSNTGTPNDDDEGSEEIPKPDNTPFGFFKRYYYIFIPLMIMNLINTVNPPPPSQGEQVPVSGTTGTPGRAAAVVAGTAATAATTAAAVGGSGGPIRNRRGKKE